MLLSKDYFDGSGFDEKAPLAGSPASSVPGTGSTTRPGSSHGRPRTSGTSGSGGTGYDNGGAGGDDAQGGDATPMSTAAVRQKMMQQRQKMLQKQRSSGITPGASSMVMANESMPSGDTKGPRSPAGPTSPSSKLGRPSVSSMSGSAAGDDNAVSSAVAAVEAARAADLAFSSDMAPPATPSSALIESAMSRASLDEDEGAAGSMAVVPDPEEEARRRSSLQSQLTNAGICPVFDPTPSGGGTEPAFDVASITPGDMKRFLHEPMPKHANMMQCRVVREKKGLLSSHPKYRMESDSGVFLMSAQKQQHNKTSNYAVSMSKTNVGKDSDAFLGKLRSDLFGLEFVAYGPGSNPKKIDSNMSQVHAVQLARQELVAVQYTSNKWGAKPQGPRKMTVVIPRVQHNGERLICRTLRPEAEGLLALQKGSDNHLVDSYQNKPPKWNDQLGAYVLNFNKRVTQASVKNFQLTNPNDPDTVYLQFGRVGKDDFNIDFRYPISPFQAFAICLSSFDYKLCCE